jgi:hypothetical protein
MLRFSLLNNRGERDDEQAAGHEGGSVVGVCGAPRFSIKQELSVPYIPIIYMTDIRPFSAKAACGQKIEQLGAIVGMVVFDCNALNSPSVEIEARQDFYL